MPERSFGRTVRYRRTKLGLSQANLGELVGRSTATIRSWERDKSRPTDPNVLSTLAAILGVSERQLFDKADVEQPDHEESSPTVEQALASLGPTDLEQLDFEESDEKVHMVEEETDSGDESDEDHEASDSIGPEREDTVRELVGASTPPAYVAPPDPYVRTPTTPPLADASYMEDRSQRQMYRVRTLATLVAVVALVVALIWAIQEGVGAFDAWWDGFFGNLRL